MTREEFLKLRPSELVRWALNDLAACEADPGYEIDMGEWHTSRAYEDHSVCQVCLAGAVMAQTLDVAYDVSLSAHGMDYAIQQQLYMLDYFQDGFIVLGLYGVGFLDETPEDWSDVDIVPYAYDPEMFRRSMEHLVSELEQKGY